MKARCMIILCLIFTPTILGQDKPISIVLSPAATTPATFLLENFPKVGCANVSIVSDESKAVMFWKPTKEILRAVADLKDHMGHDRRDRRHTTRFPRVARSFSELLQ
jgi:hypothetical protein